MIDRRVWGAGSTAALCCLLPLLSCRERRASAPPKPRLGQARVLMQVPGAPNSAARSAQGRLAVGLRDGRVLVTTGKDQRWVALDLPRSADKTSEKAAGPVHDGPVVTLTFSRDGKHLLSAGGRAVAWWQVTPPRLLHQVRGPQLIAAAVLGPQDREALFGTVEGHLLRWPLNRAEASAAQRLGCGALVVDPRRERLPVERRCPFGTYRELDTGQAVCTYPLTHLVRRGTRLLRACRTGNLGVFDLSGRNAPRHLAAGALGAVAFVDDHRVVLAREDGELRLYDVVSQTTRPLGRLQRPELVVANAKLVAATSRRSLRLWAIGNPMPVRKRLPVSPVWMHLTGDTLELLLADGQLIAFALS